VTTASLLSQINTLLSQIRNLVPSSITQSFTVTSGSSVEIPIANDTELYNALLNVKGGETLRLAPGKYSSITIYKKTSTSANADRIGVGAVYKSNATPVLTAPVTVTSADPSNRAVIQSLELTNSEKWRFVGLSFRPSPKQKAVAFTTNDFKFINNDISSGDATNWTDTDWLNTAGDAIDGNPYDQTYSRPRNEIAYNYIKNVHLGIGAGSNAYVHHNVVRGFSNDGSRCNDNCVFENNIFTELARVDSNHPDAFQSFTKDKSGGTVGAGNNVNTVMRYNTMITSMKQAVQPDSFQGIGMYDGTYENWVFENNLIINDHEHGISVYGPINSVIRNNAGFTYSTEINKDGRGLIRFFNHKDGRPPVGSTMSGNISSNLPTSNSGVTVTSHTVAKLADYDKYFVDYRNHDFTLKPGSIPFAVGANIDPNLLAPEPYATPGSAISLVGYGTQTSYPLPPSVSKLPAPTLTLTATVATLSTGAATTLTWSTTNATACTASGDWAGTKSANGSDSTGVQYTSGTKTFTLMCTGGGGKATKSVTVTVSGVSQTPPSTVTPTSTVTSTGASSATSTLTTTQSAASTWTYCAAENGTCSFSGTKQVRYGDGTIYYVGTFTGSVMCSNVTFGDPQKTVKKHCDTAPVPTNTPTPLPTLTLSAAVTALTTGSATTLTWSTTNAAVCTASDSWAGAKSTNGTESTGNQTTAGIKTYTLTCTGSGGTVSKSVSITVTASAPATDPGTTSGGSSGGTTSSGSTSSTGGNTSSGGSSSGSASGGTQNSGGTPSTGTSTGISASSSVHRVVTTNMVNVRNAPLGTKVGTHGRGAQGTQSDALGVVKGGYTWVYVNFDTGVDGYVASQFLTAATGSTSSQSTQDKIAALMQQLQMLMKLLAQLQGK
jgi:hypothetical protein